MLTASLLVLFVLVASGATARRGRQADSFSVGSLPSRGTATTTDQPADLATQVAYWHAKAAKRLAIAGRFERQRNRARAQLRQSARGYSVGYAIKLASRVYGVSESKMRSVAWCESRFYPYAVNGQYKGIFQMHWSPFGFSPFDPVASALSAAQTVVHDGSWRQWECG